MPSGGHARSGPAPDPNALRRARKDDAGWITLPSEVRTDAAPEWPLPEPEPRELAVWAEWWTYPVSVLWESPDIYYVAFTVRMFCEAEKPKARTEDRKSLRTMMADLYLTRGARAHARIHIVGDELGARRDEPTLSVVEDEDDERDRFAHGGV